MPRVDRSGNAGSARCRASSFLGLHWMHTIKSGLLCGVGGDAQYVAEHIDLMAG